MTSATKRVLVTDLDNTLWDWFDAWHQSFSAMLKELVRISGVPQAVLEMEIHAVHQRRGTVEYSNLIDELPSLRGALSARHRSDPIIWRHYLPAVTALRETRRQSTRLYPQVRETLISLKNAGFEVIAYTESLAYWTEWRIRHTELDGIIDVLYSAPDHDLPQGMTTDDLRSQPREHYGLAQTRHLSIPRGTLKPNPEVLLEILARSNYSAEDAVYVGDSLMKDITMAQDAGVTDVHARYGEAQDRAAYDQLVKVTHWSDRDVARERQLNRDRTKILPTFTCELGFFQLTDILSLENK